MWHDGLENVTHGQQSKSLAVTNRGAHSYKYNQRYLHKVNKNSERIRLGTHRGHTSRHTAWSPEIFSIRINNSKRRGTRTYALSGEVGLLTL